MLLRAQAYDYKLSYLPGRQLVVADALSRAPISRPPDDDIAAVSSLALTPFNRQRLGELKHATSSDGTMRELMSIILKGWPDYRNEVPSAITPFFDYRDELTVQDGIVLRGERVVIHEEGYASTSPCWTLGYKLMHQESKRIDFLAKNVS